MIKLSQWMILGSILCFAQLTMAKNNKTSQGTEERMSVSDFFNTLNFSNMESACTNFYHPDVTFIDPVGQINGLEQMIKYYKHLYENVIEIKFIPQNEIIKNDETVFVWEMHVKHKKIKGGENIVVEGVSIVKYQGDKVIYHRDYFDIGEMVYENIPILGSMIRWIKDGMHAK